MKVRPSNGVNFGVKYTVTADDATAGSIDFDFRIASDDFRFGLVASVTVLAETTGIITMPADLAITYPNNGVVTVSGTLVAGSVICLVAQGDSLSF